MFIDIRATHNFDKLLNWAKQELPQQVDFAHALTLTKTGQDFKGAIEREMASVFTAPTPFTMRGFRLFPATKKRLEARVVFRHDLSRDYLGPQIMGGERKLKAFERSLQRVGVLPRHLQAVPGSAAKLDQFGNMARSQIVQLLSYFQAFSEQGYRANMTDKRKRGLAKAGKTESGYKTINGVEYFVVSKTKAVRGRQQTLPEGIWSRSGVHGVDVKPVVLFVRKARYTKRLRFFELAQEIVRDRLTINFHAAWERARKTARP